MDHLIPVKVALRIRPPTLSSNNKVINNRGECLKIIEKESQVNNY